MAKQKIKIQIQIVTWNSLKFLPECLSSIFNQNDQGFSVLVIDNASNDGTLEFIKNNYPDVKIFRNNKNLGFSAAHNQGIKIACLDEKNFDKKFILLLNPDVILSHNFIENAKKIIEKNKEIGAFAGKILKVYTSEPEINEKIKTEIIDSVGLKILKSRQVIDRGENEKDIGQYNNEEEVFGVSGACAFYRLSALEDIKIKDECLDEDFFAYKEDADLGYRLRWRGYKIMYFPQLIAYHHRQVFGGKGEIRELIRQRRERSSLVKYLSYRNHLFLLAKNETLINFIKYLPWIFLYELKKIIYLLILEPKTLKAILNFLIKLPQMLKKRSWIMKNKKISSKELEKWFK